MTRRHPDRQLLERFMRDELQAPERRRVVRHLLAGCERCLEVTRRLWLLGDRALSGRALPPEPGEVLHPSSYRDLFDRLIAEGGRREERIAQEREEAPPLLAEILTRPQADRLGAVYADERFGSLALCDLLLDRGREAAARGDLAEAAELAEIAIAAAEHLDETLCGASLVQDVKARGWSRLGDARRAAADLAGAERAFRVAGVLLERGSGDPLERAELASAEAALEAARGRFAAAAERFEHAAALYRAAEAQELLGGALARAGMASGQAGERERAIGLLAEGIALLEDRRDPRFLGEALREMAKLLLAASRTRDAAAYLRRARVLAAGDPPERARLRWLEGLAACALGRSGEAEAALAEARAGLLAAGVGEDAAGVLLDLAALLSRQGRGDEVRGLTAELFPSLRVRELRHGAMAALLVLRRTVETERATLEFLAEVARYLRRAQSRPALPPWV